MEKAIWVSFDLGLNGDYEGMYGWLDEHKAKECGDNFAFVRYPFSKNPVEAVKRGIKNRVTLDKRSRIYMIYLNDEGKMKGTFIFGARKQPPWTGYGATAEEESIDEP